MVYSDYNLAIREAHKWVDRLERDLYLCCVNYPSGREFVLKENLPEGFDHVECIRLPFHHKFRSQFNAARAADVFERRMGRRVFIDKSTYLQNGYRKTSHWNLCLT